VSYPARFVALSRTLDAVRTARGVLLVRHSKDAVWLNDIEAENLQVFLNQRVPSRNAEEAE
jgi:hypothetical protein